MFKKIQKLQKMFFPFFMLKPPFTVTLGNDEGHQLRVVNFNPFGKNF